MNRHAKIRILVFLTLAFIVAKVLCCCVIKESFAAFKKASCSHCTTKTSHDASSGCCFLKGSPMEQISNQHLNAILPFVSLIVIAFLYIKPQIRLTYRNLYLNGPPGPFTLVPLYIQSRSIRI